MGSAQRVEVVFLDMGDTLVRLADPLNAIYLRLAAETGVTVGKDHFARTQAEVVRETDARNHGQAFAATRAADRLQWRDFNSRLLQRLEIAEHLWDAAQREIEEAFVNPANFSIFPEVPETLARLRSAGYRLAICSNWSWDLPLICERLDLTTYFEQIVVSARVGYAKPHPAIFQHALAAMQVRPDAAIHVGDNPIADVGGALRAGLCPVLLDRAGENAGVEAPYRVTDLRQLLDLLPTLGVGSTENGFTTEDTESTEGKRRKHD
jgi:putative hydrolase of the HAD superfamily